MIEYKFTLMGRSILLNELLRLHWAKRKRALSNLQWAVWVMQKPPVSPLPKSTVHVLRHSLVLPDQDNLSGTMKLLMDVLVKNSKKHPHGLGFIEDDDPGHVASSIESVKCATRKEQRLEVTIRETE